MATLNDLVLVKVDNRPGFYARIEDIVPDVKPGWWQVKLLVLTFPLQYYTWILDESQINGAPFTMGGTPLVIEKIEPPVSREVPGKREKKAIAPAGGSAAPERPKIVSLSDRKKEKDRN